jgi:hypothetical protein
VNAGRREASPPQGKPAEWQTCRKANRPQSKGPARQAKQGEPKKTGKPNNAIHTQC